MTIKQFVWFCIASVAAVIVGIILAFIPAIFIFGVLLGMAGGLCVFIAAFTLAEYLASKKDKGGG